LVAKVSLLLHVMFYYGFRLYEVDTRHAVDDVSYNHSNMLSDSIIYDKSRRKPLRLLYEILQPLPMDTAFPHGLVKVTTAEWLRAT